MAGTSRKDLGTDAVHDSFAGQQSGHIRNISGCSARHAARVTGYANMVTKVWIVEVVISITWVATAPTTCWKSEDKLCISLSLEPGKDKLLEGSGRTSSAAIASILGTVLKI